MESRSMVLYINRNTRTTKGNFIVRELWEDSKGYAQSKDTKYPVKMKHNRIIPTKPIADDKLRKEIENFKFLYNTVTLKILMIIKMVTYHIIPMYLVIRPSIN